MGRSPNKAGISQFHRCKTASPNPTAKIDMAMMPIMNNFANLTALLTAIGLSFYLKNSSYTHCNLVRDKHLVLLIRQFVQGGLKLLNQDSSYVSCFRTSIRGGQELLDRKHF